MNTYFIEITDTYGGEANYCWVRRYLVKGAKTMRGALRKVQTKYGGYWRQEFNYSDFSRYNLKGAAICMFINWVDDQEAMDIVDRYSNIEVIN